MMKTVAVILGGTLLVVGCGQTSSPSSPTTTAAASSFSSSAIGTALSSPGSPQMAHAGIGFGLNGTVSGFPTGEVFLTGGGEYDPAENFVKAGGGFRCDEAVLQGPLSTSLNPDDPGPCQTGEGVRWDTASLLNSTTFKCTNAANEPLKTAVTSGATVVLQADFYRASNGDEASFTAKMIVSNTDIAADFPGARVWVQGVGCGTPIAVNFSR